MEPQIKSRLINTALFLLTGFIGFWSMPICYYTLYLLDIIGADYFIEHSRLSFQSWFMGITIIWFISLIFSFAGIFMHKKERGLLFAAPVILPIAYGFISLSVSG